MKYNDDDDDYKTMVLFDSIYTDDVIGLFFLFFSHLHSRQASHF